VGAVSVGPSKRELRGSTRSRAASTTSPQRGEPRCPSSGRVAGCRRLIRSPGIGRFPDYATLKSIDHRRVEESSSRYRENRAGKASRQDPVSCEATDNPAWIRASAGMTTIDQAGGRTWRQDPASCSAREKSDRVRATLDAVFP